MERQLISSAAISAVQPVRTPALAYIYRPPSACLHTYIHTTTHTNEHTLSSQVQKAPGHFPILLENRMAKLHSKLSGVAYPPRGNLALGNWLCMMSSLWNKHVRFHITGEVASTDWFTLWLLIVSTNHSTVLWLVYFWLH